MWLLYDCKRERGEGGRGDVLGCCTNEDKINQEYYYMYVINYQK